MTEKNIITLGVRVPEDLAEQFKALSAAMRLTYSQRLRHLMAEDIEKARIYHASLNVLFSGWPTVSTEHRVKSCSTALNTTDVDVEDDL